MLLCIALDVTDRSWTNCQEPLSLMLQDLIKLFAHSLILNRLIQMMMMMMRKVSLQLKMKAEHLQKQLLPALSQPLVDCLLHF